MPQCIKLFKILEGTNIWQSCIQCCLLYYFLRKKVMNCNSTKKIFLLQVVHTKAIAALTQFCDFSFFWIFFNFVSDLILYFFSCLLILFFFSDFKISFLALYLLYFCFFCYYNSSFYNSSVCLLVCPLVYLSTISYILLSFCFSYRKVS